LKTHVQSFQVGEKLDNLRCFGDLEAAHIACWAGSRIPEVLIGKVRLGIHLPHQVELGFIKNYLLWLRLLRWLLALVVLSWRVRRCSRRLLRFNLVRVLERLVILLLCLLALWLVEVLDVMQWKNYFFEFGLGVALQRANQQIKVFLEL